MQNLPSPVGYRVPELYMYNKIPHFTHTPTTYSPIFHRRLADGDVHCAGSATYQIITSISATNQIGHMEYDIGHKQNRYRPQVDIGHKRLVNLPLLLCV